MTGFWVTAALLLLAVALLCPNYNRHRVRRQTVRQVRARLTTRAPDPVADPTASITVAELRRRCDADNLPRYPSSSSSPTPGSVASDPDLSTLPGSTPDTGCAA
ncbi:hypothetical protein ACFFQW_35975 [Umezawaea endophytica]|uniref:Uncharacterized protein n=1 Tax=Umezawaea endophytica TaxID=1654476 RepID=A0A9X2VLP9_9PSEU|nr:hypothetical protein [Umezawaea endophytica]MCS7477503.1 hypothetical protein [Umezawaea endophytica]